MSEYDNVVNGDWLSYDEWLKKNDISKYKHIVITDWVNVETWLEKNSKADIINVSVMDNKFNKDRYDFIIIYKENI